MNARQIAATTAGQSTLALENTAHKKVDTFVMVVFVVVGATVLVVVVIAIEEWMEVTHALSPPERLSFALCECACNFYKHP